MSDPWRKAPTPTDPLSGYTSPPPPGASGMPSHTTHGHPAGGTWELAGWWSRVGAAVVDGLVLSVMALVLLVAVGAIAGTGFLLGETAGVVGLIVGFLLWGAAVTVAAFLYAPLMMAKTNGKTLGRMATGIRVVRADGRRMDFGWAALREVVVKWLLFGTVLNSVTFGLASLLDVLWPLWDEENRALHDFVVNTRVIKD
jgi:uncharacterized RDD family membrane protein YckC